MKQTNNTQNEATPTEKARAEIAAFGSHYHYDIRYMTEMLEANEEAYRAFAGFLPMVRFRQHADLHVYFTAKLTAFQQVDCGPCLQLAVRMAKESGLSSDWVHAVLSADETLSPLLQRVRRFSQAVLTDDLECDLLRAGLAEDLGKATMVELALAIASAQIFPAVKRAMGHHQSCSITPLEL